MLFLDTVLLLCSRWQQHHKIQKNKIHCIHAVSKYAALSSFWTLKLERLKCRFPVGTFPPQKKKNITMIAKYLVQLEVNDF